MERVVVWKLDSLVELENIPTLLNMNHDKLITYLEDEDIPIIDKTLCNSWLSSNRNNHFTIEEETILNHSIRFIVAYGNYEVCYGENKAYINGVLLERRQRIFNKTCKVIYFEYENEVYIVTKHIIPAGVLHKKTA